MLEQFPSPPLDDGGPDPKPILAKERRYDEALANCKKKVVNWLASVGEESSSQS